MDINRVDDDDDLGFYGARPTRAKSAMTMVGCYDVIIKWDL